MTQMVYGLPSTEAYESRGEFTEYRGLRVIGESEDWRCSRCDSKVIPEFTPASGICSEEAPAQLLKALNKFVERLSLSAALDYWEKSNPPESTVSIVCGGPSLEFAIDADPEHSSRGDWLEIQVCHCLTLKIYFNGTGQLIDKTYEGSSLADDLERYEQDFVFPSSANAISEIDDLINGKEFLLSVSQAINRYRSACISANCNHG
jgi:hypothetical protein